MEHGIHLIGVGGEIRAEIARTGPVSFARFMELALYSPGTGYYEREREIGRRGDFFTSVSVGPVFGQLLASQFARWLEQIPAALSGRRQMVEAGAHDGQLALDILQWLRQWRPEIPSSVDYWIIEPSPTRRARQKKKLEEWSNVKWAADIGELGGGQIHGVIFSNELLDALPVHRVCWDATLKTWREWRVVWQESRFVWQKSALSQEAAAALPVIPSAMAEVLPDEYIIEISPAALQWWTRAANALGCGKLLTLDYGFGEGEWLRPEFASGTLRAYRGHHLSGDLLADPGGQDLTAHVNFPAIRDAGGKAGLCTETLARQSKFLTELFQQGFNHGGGFDKWTAGEIRQFQTLTHPEHLGHHFRVLIQQRKALPTT